MSTRRSSAPASGGAAPAAPAPEPRLIRLQPRSYTNGVVNTEYVKPTYVNRDAVVYVTAISDYQPKDDPDPVTRCAVVVGVYPNRTEYTLHESVDSVVARLGGYV